MARGQQSHAKEYELIRINLEAFEEAIKRTKYPKTILSILGGKEKSYLNQVFRNNQRVSIDFVETLKQNTGIDMYKYEIKEQPQTDITNVTNVTNVTPVNGSDTEKIISAIGQATGIISNQLAEIIKLLKSLNESREAEITTMRKSITDSMVSAIILGLQESKGTISDGVKLGISNSGELRNAITQGIRSANR